MAEGDSQDQSAEKTEEPTQRRIDEAVKKGQVAFSREVTSFLFFIVLCLYIIWFAPYVMEGTAFTLAGFIERPHQMRVDAEGGVALLGKTMDEMAPFFFLPLAATIIATFVSSLLQNGVVISVEPLIPKVEKISVIKGVKRMFSLRSLTEFGKGLIKITAVGIVSVIVLRPHLPRLDTLPGYDVIDLMALLATLSFRVALGAVMVMAVMAVIDYMYQRFEYMKSLRMTKQEIKDEFKQTEGDPAIKARLRQIRSERARKRMMQAVPEADVVITNPEHYAVALKYDEKTMQAPVLVAKGVEFLALRIREVAKEHAIPIVENPPLARGLYADAEVDEEIPLEFYHAVAEVISYVYRLKNKYARG